MRRFGGIVLGLVVVAAAVAVGYAVRTASEPETAPPETIPVDTVEVVRTDLVQFETLSGTLQYTGEGQVRTALPGTVTSIPDEASSIERGTPAFEVDGDPVVLMIGGRPAWRPFVEGMSDGPDVAQLEENLHALGYGPEDWEADTEFDGETADAVEAWREDLALPDGREVELGRIIFLPDPVRVGAANVDTGELVVAGTPIYAITDFEQEVAIELDPDDIDLVEVGAPVTVVLPDDREVAGAISQIGRVVQRSGPGPDAAAFLDVTVRLSETDLGLDRAPVDVEVESERAAGVLAVPVRALVALSGGGYAVEIDGELIGVETGDFAGGLVEVTGALEEGDQVVVPQ